MERRQSQSVGSSAQNIPLGSVQRSGSNGSRPPQGSNHAARPSQGTHTHTRASPSGTAHHVPRSSLSTPQVPAVTTSADTIANTPAPTNFISPTTYNSPASFTVTAPILPETPSFTKDAFDHLLRPSENVKNLQYIALNTVSTVAVVFLNKITFDDPQLRNLQIVNAIWHFLTTFIVLWVASRRPFSMFTVVREPILEMIPICAFFAGFLVLNNLSLTYNSVGFYQLAKVLTTPCVVLLNFLVLHKTISRTMLAAVLISCMGIALTNGDMVSSNVFGAMMATGAFIITALYQIWIGKKMKDLQLSAAQLLINQAPIASLLLVGLVPFFDTVPNLYTIPAPVLWAFFFSGVVASLINLSQFLIIKGTSVLTFNIIGLVKTIAIVGIGWYMEGKMLGLKDLAGVTMALGGAWIYSQAAAASKER